MGGHGNKRQKGGTAKTTSKSGTSKQGDATSVAGTDHISLLDCFFFSAFLGSSSRWILGKTPPGYTRDGQLRSPPTGNVHWQQETCLARW